MKNNIFSALNAELPEACGGIIWHSLFCCFEVAMKGKEMVPLLLFKNQTNAHV